MAKERVITFWCPAGKHAFVAEHTYDTPCPDHPDQMCTAPREIVTDDPAKAIESHQKNPRDHSLGADWVPEKPEPEKRTRRFPLT